MDGPVAFGVQVGIEVRMLLVEDLGGGKLVEAQQPVGLIQPVLAQQRGFGVQRGQQRILGHRNVGGAGYALVLLFAKALGQPQNLIIRFGACADDHLRALPRGRELRGFAIPHQLGLALRDALAHLPMARMVCSI